ncbi:MAG TPA: hypothetical protein VMW55_02885 [Nitrosopumilaceae archaeon]|nr:hypothetical protein [Nitrosopumilaceae archaeon]
MFNSFFYAAVNATATSKPFFEDIPSLLGIGTMLLALATVATLIFTIRQNNDVKYLDFVKSTDAEISQQLEKELHLKGRDDCIIYGYNYIDMCDRIMFLIKKRKVPQEFLEYYLGFFNYAITMMWWYAKIYPNDEHSLKSSWLSLKRWIAQKNEINPYPLMHLPAEMKKILSDMNIKIDIDHNTILKNIEESYSFNENKF